MSEEEKVEEKQEEKPVEEEKVEETSEGETSEESPIELANDAAKRLEEANKESDRIAKKNEKILAEMKLQGRSVAGGQPIPAKRLTDTEYAEALERGEVNPLKEDGIFK